MKAAGVSSVALAAMVVLLTMTLFTVEPTRAAVTCSDVRSQLLPCFGYATGSTNSPTQDCCNRVRNLDARSQTPEDRRAACKCIRELANQVPGIRLDRATQLPRQCGVNVDPNQNCDSIR